MSHQSVHSMSQMDEHGRSDPRDSTIYEPVGLGEREMRYTRAGDIGRLLQQRRPKAPCRLGWFSVVCIIANRMIGSGIFITPTTLVRYTQSLGIALIFWFAGAITTIGGIMMFMEYGLCSPRFRFEHHPYREKKPVPRSGGELHYLKEIFKRPQFFAVCLYGIAFVLIGNVATNSMAFGVRVLQAAGRVDANGDILNNWEARGIAIAVVTMTCLIHAVWRLGGIYLINIFAIVKVTLLLFIFATGCATWGGAFKRVPGAAENLNSGPAFANSSSDAYSFAESYLAVIFAYGGLQQANLVIGEIDDPKRKYKWPAFFSVSGICALYLLVNIAYMLVVPADEQKGGADIARRFFDLTYGTLPGGADLALRLLYGFMSVSILGNIIVMTYTAARVKQEIAKEGILPFRRFLSSTYEMPGLPFDWLLCRTAKPYKEEIPRGALILHWIVSVLLIVFTAALDPLRAYSLLVSLYSYTIDAFFGVVLALGIIYMRANASRNWHKYNIWPGWISVTAALLYGLSMAFPVIASWIPPSTEFVQKIGLKYPWFAVPTVSWSVIGLGALWWIGYTQIYPLTHRNMTLVVQRLIYINDQEILHHEKFGFTWTVNESGHGEKVEDNTKVSYEMEDEDEDKEH